jgi:hypothetical protein
MLVSRFRPVYDSLVHALSGTKVILGWETSPESAAHKARAEAYPVLLVTAEYDSRLVIERCGSSNAPPNIIVLLPVFDSELWAQGLQAGAFEVLPVDVDGDKLVSTLLAAQQRWERRRLIRAARAQNSMVLSTQS